MKKVAYLSLVALFLFLGVKANASVSFDEAFSKANSKPMLVLVYADWADNYEVFLEKFRGLEQEFGDEFNYVELDIAKPEAKSFNARYHIYPNLPYILMYRDGGKVSRYIQRNCAINESCMVPRIRSFAR